MDESKEIIKTFQLLGLGEPVRNGYGPLTKDANEFFDQLRNQVALLPKQRQLWLRVMGQLAVEPLRARGDFAARAISEHDPRNSTKRNLIIFGSQAADVLSCVAYLPRELCLLQMMHNKWHCYHPDFAMDDKNAYKRWGKQFWRVQRQAELAIIFYVAELLHYDASVQKHSTRNKLDSWLHPHCTTRKPKEAKRYDAARKIQAGKLLSALEQLLVCFLAKKDPKIFMADDILKIIANINPVAKDPAPNDWVIPDGLLWRAFVGERARRGIVIPPDPNFYLRPSPSPAQVAQVLAADRELP